MTARSLSERQIVVRWVRTMLGIFLLLGLSFGTWLSRLPAVRDRLDASTLEMSIYGLCLAAGSVVGLVISGQVVQRFGPKRTMLITGLAQVVALPLAVTIILFGAIPIGLVVLFVFGFFFATADVAMNVSGANAERALGRARLPLMHAGYSTGTVAAMGLGALAEAVGVGPQLHFVAIFTVIGVTLIFLLRNVPSDEQALRARATETAVLDATGPIPIVESSSGRQPAFSTMTGAIPVVTSQIPLPPSASNAQTPLASPPITGPPARYSPWRDRRVLLIGLIALATGIVEGTAADWLPLALVDGRGVANQTGALMLGVFFASIMLVRVAGSALLNRFGRVKILYACALLSTIGIVTVLVVPGTVGLLLGAIAWGLGGGLGWPIAISAAADRRETAVRDVAAVSALGYGSMLLGPMAFGLLGEFVGLLTAFWALLIFTAITALVARAAREGGSTELRKGRLSR
ncbi:MFS transporter [Leucobacter sp. W1478]|uniref:MFS transporter n=1 Tax=Leucobacter sp. W1478 TaxID=3439065 RepID=UPI003F3B9229